MRVGRCGTGDVGVEAPGDEGVEGCAEALEEAAARVVRPGLELVAGGGAGAFEGCVGGEGGDALVDYRNEGLGGWATEEFAEDAVEVAGGNGYDGAVHFDGVWGDVRDDEETVKDMQWGGDVVVVFPEVVGEPAKAADEGWEEEGLEEEGEAFFKSVEVENPLFAGEHGLHEEGWD